MYKVRVVSLKYPVFCEKYERTSTRKKRNPQDKRRQTTIGWERMVGD